MIKLANIFSDRAVFAADKPAAVFGDGCGAGYVTMAGNRAEITCSEGKWLAELPPMPCGGPYELCIYMNGETKTLQDIYIGRVYLLIGQSNAEFMLAESNTPPESCADDGLFRLFKVDRLFSGADRHITEADGWCPAAKENLPYWNAIGYLAGRIIRRRDGVAVGIIACCQGASVIESWLPAGEADEFGIRPGDKHKDHTSPLYSAFNSDGDIYSRMLSGLFPYRVTKAVWYQGESDTTVAEGSIYEYEAKKLFEIIRRDFRQPELEFTVIQIADFIKRDDAGWKAVQQAQLRLPEIMDGVSTVICADVCENDAIHPKSKEKLSQRVAELL